MSSFLRDPKRLIATLIALASGLIVLFDFAGTVPAVDTIARLLIQWAALLAALALLVGLLNVTGSHFERVLRRQPDWGYSLVLLVSMFVVLIFGIVIGPVDEQSFVVLPNLLEPPIPNLFNAVYLPLAGSFLALLTFFSLSAALRSVQRRSADALVIVVVAMVVLALTALPAVEQLPFVGEALRWTQDFVVLAVARGLIVGAALGALVAGVRVLLGFDQPYLDR